MDSSTPVPPMSSAPFSDARLVSLAQAHPNPHPSTPAQTHRLTVKELKQRELLKREGFTADMVERRRMARSAPTPPKSPRPTPAPFAKTPVLEPLKQKLRCARATLRKGLIDERECQRLIEEATEWFWATQAVQTPIITPDGESGTHAIVTFLWRDAEAKSVLLFVNRITDERNLQDSMLKRVRGTDVWYIAYRMETDWRASYCFLPFYGKTKVVDVVGHDQASIRHALDRGLTDPRNPKQCMNRVRNTLSVVELPDAPPQPWQRARREGEPHGNVTSHTVDDRLFWLYEPPFAADARREDVPAIVMFDGDMWARTALFPQTLDNLIGDGRIPPMYALLVESSSLAARWDELSEDAGVEQFVVQHLLTWVRERHPVTDDPRRLVVAGQSLGGLMALWTVLRCPDRIGNVIAQSSSLWRGRLMARLADPANLLLNGFDGRVYMEVGRQEWVLLPHHRQLARIFGDKGIDCRYVEYNGGHDYACWRGGIADGLCWVADGWR